MNWAAPGDNYTAGPVVPTGLSTSDGSYSSVYLKAANILSQLHAQGVRTVRLPINPTTVLGSEVQGDRQNPPPPWWSEYQGAVDAATDLGMNVILSYWNANKTGWIEDEVPWSLPVPGISPPQLDCSDPASPYARFNEMWQQVVSEYANQPHVYFEPMNEPYGYLPGAWDSVAEQWLQCFGAPNQVPNHRVIVPAATTVVPFLGCVGVQNDPGVLASDPNLDGTLLSVHFYDFNCSGRNDESVFNTLTDPSYRGRVVVDEFGTGVGKGMTTSTDPHVRYLQDLSKDLNREGMGAVYWAGIKGCDPGKPCDPYSAWWIDGNGNLQLRGDGSILNLLQQAWGERPVHARRLKRLRRITSCRTMPTGRSQRLCRVHHRLARRPAHRATKAHHKRAKRTGSAHHKVRKRTAKAHHTRGKRTRRARSRAKG